MGNIRAKPSGKLYFDFRYLGKRCREITELADTLANRKRLDVVMRRIEAEILTGTFSYDVNGSLILTPLGLNSAI